MKVTPSFVVDGQTVGYAVMLLLLFQTSQGFASLPALPFGEAQLQTYYQWPLTIALVGTLLLAAVRARSSSPFPTRILGLFATVCILVGDTFAFGVSWSAGLPPALCLQASAAFFGVGLALSFALWQRIIAAEALALARPKIILGTALASLADIGLAQVKGSIALAALVAILALTNGALLRQSSQLRATPKPASAQDASSLRRLFSSIWRYVLCVGVIGFVSKTSQELAVQLTGATMNVFFAVAMLASALAMILIWLRGRTLSLHRTFIVLSTLVTASFLTLLFASHSAVPYIAAFAFFAFSVVSMLMVLTTMEVAASRKFDPTFVFGFFAGTAYLITDAGPLLTGTLETHFDLSPVLVVSVTAVYLVAFAGLVLNITKDATSRSSASDSASPYEPDETPGEDLSAKFVRPVVVLQDVLLLCCQLLQKRYQLTNRETEILELIARGRDLARMADVLFVSQNTIRSHSRNLYRKLNVHSKQEALDLLEQAREEVLAAAPPAN